jgi:hypothetical protein
VQEIISLSKQYGILTEYTSFLVDMDMTAPPMMNAGVAGPGGALAPTQKALTRTDTELAAEAATRIEGMRAVTGGMSGITQSVNRKAASDAYQVANARGNYILNEAGERVMMGQMQNVASRSFVQNGAQWVDVNYKAAQRVVRVKPWSPAYMQIANSNARMAQYMSVSDNMVVGLKDTAVVIAEDGQETEFKPEEFAPLQQEIDSTLGVTPEIPVTAATLLPPRTAGHEGPLALLALAAVAGLSLFSLRRRTRAA